MHFDTSFLIDLERETIRGRPGPAFEFLESLDEGELLAVSVHVVSELRTGAEMAKQPLQAHDGLDQLLSGWLVVHTNDRFPTVFARVAAATRRGTKPVGSMDMLIATAALLDDAPLVTKNVKDFSKVPGLRVLGY